MLSGEKQAITDQRPEQDEEQGREEQPQQSRDKLRHCPWNVSNEPHQIWKTTVKRGSNQNVANIIDDQDPKTYL